MHKDSKKSILNTILVKKNLELFSKEDMGKINKWI
jgi:hypothetical protein